ncbi:hypothetical protein DPMN_097957 [Dreissena polymorpha]|uniref:Uncharacterized protein n=1 Tax=Dreissena polymorpha TaxID=45954 RepID=A0A9D4R6U0_DREPO|nr:hypothetical protein DPMN_097957 [Dreissena polymorpha]
MAPDGRKDGKTDRQRQNNIPLPMAGDNKLQLGQFNNCTTMTTNICAKGQLAWFGHFTRHDSLYKTLLQGTL